ncbi:MAG TPA: hypothetical protein PK869_08475 [Candidatus Hydrogenedentes bacterium]|nr:hypothetical protein [Candidatus Hydrogenedentota bacterium]
MTKETKYLFFSAKRPVTVSLIVIAAVSLFYLFLHDWSETAILKCLIQLSSVSFFAIPVWYTLGHTLRRTPEITDIPLDGGSEATYCIQKIMQIHFSSAFLTFLYVFISATRALDWLMDKSGFSFSTQLLITIGATILVLMGVAYYLKSLRTVSAVEKLVNLRTEKRAL